MTVPTQTVVVDQAYQLDYDTLKNIVANCGGWIRSSGGGEGETAEVWHDDTKYIFKDRGLIDFLYAVKTKHITDVYAAIDLCDYIEKSAKQPASVFVRDAIVARAAELKAQIQGTADDVASPRKRGSA